MTISSHDTMAPSRQFGPWASGLDPAEQRARLRSLRAIARLVAGPRADAVVKLLRQAEDDPAALVPAADALDRLEPLDRRRILGSFAGLGTHPATRPLLLTTPRPREPHRDPRRPLPRRLPAYRHAA